MRGRIIMVGPGATAGAPQHPGGQLTAANGIADYARARNYDLRLVNTLINNFPPPSFGRKLQLAARRALLFVRELLAGRVQGVILFAGARHSFFERVFLAALANVRGVRTLFCIREGLFIEWMRSSRLTRFVVPLLLRIPDRIVLQGSAFETALADEGVPRAKLVVVRNWLPADYEVVTHAKSVERGTPLRLIFVGWLVEGKGVRELLDAFMDLSTRHALTLDVIGGGTLEQELRERVAASRVSSIRIHGWLSPREVTAHLDRAHVFVLPTYSEGFPNALLEAMARGLPAVCSDVGAIAGSIDSGVNGFLVRPRDHVQLAEAIENYLKKPSLVEEHSRATLARVTAAHDRDTNLARLFDCMA